MARHYKSQPMFDSKRPEERSTLEVYLRERNQHVEPSVPKRDHCLKYHCQCGRMGGVVVYCRAGEVFAHNCPKCSQPCILEANPAVRPDR